MIEIRVGYHDFQRFGAEGAEAVFIPFAFHLDGQWWGVKAYRRRAERDRAVDRQRALAQLGLAPPTGFRVRVVIGGRSKVRRHFIRQGYITGQARPFQGEDDTHEIKHLEHRLEKAGVKPSDLRARNVGWWRDSLVAIDFGDISTMGIRR